MSNKSNTNKLCKYKLQRIYPYHGFESSIFMSNFSIRISNMHWAPRGFDLMYTRVYRVKKNTDLYQYRLQNSKQQIILMYFYSFLFLFLAPTERKTMAPTICDDTMEPYGNRNMNRMRRHCSVINYGKRMIVDWIPLVSCLSRHPNVIKLYEALWKNY